MRRAIERAMWSMIVLGASCSEDEPRPCDEGTPTCESSLLVILEDPRTEFTITLKDDVGLDLVIDCPLAEGDAGVYGDYTVVCGGGRVTLTTFRYFSDVIEVQLEEAETKRLTAEQQRGADFCGNPCNNATVQL